MEPVILLTKADLAAEPDPWAHVGSNVVDAPVRTLRRKLGSRRAMIETIPKLGYRFRPDGH